MSIFWAGRRIRSGLETRGSDRSRVLLWHANYHPDGGQLFFPLDATPFVVPLALPGDDLKPEQFVSFYFDGSCGLYINPDIWHEGVFPLAERGRFFDKQGKAHARISTDFQGSSAACCRPPCGTRQLGRRVRHQSASRVAGLIGGDPGPAGRITARQPVLSPLRPRGSSPARRPRDGPATAQRLRIETPKPRRTMARIIATSPARSQRLGMARAGRKKRRPRSPSP
jgi:hypothetical protein